MWRRRTGMSVAARAGRAEPARPGPPPSPSSRGGGSQLALQGLGERTSEKLDVAVDESVVHGADPVETEDVGHGKTRDGLRDVARGVLAREHLEMQQRGAATAFAAALVRRAVF